MSTRDQQCFALGPDCKSSSTCLRRPFTLRGVNIDGNCIRRLGTLLGSTVTTTSVTTTSESTIRSSTISSIAPTPTNTPSGPSSSPAGSRPRPQAGAFVGIGLGSAAVAVGSTLLCIYLLLRRKRRNTSASLSEGVLPTTASDIAHGDPGGLGTRSIHGDSRRGSEREHPSPGPRWSDRGTSGSMGEPCLCLPPWTSDKSAPSGLTSSLEEHAAGGQPDERAAEPNATSRSDGVFADGSETDTVGSLGAPPAYGGHHVSGGGELANGRRGSHGWLEDFADGSQSEVTVSTLPPPYAEQ